jgi:hypothetical protein
MEELMEEGSIEHRLEVVEQEMRDVMGRLADAEGEAMFAGQVAALALSCLIASGTLPAASAREAIDRLLLAFEQAQAQGILVPRAAEHARSRTEATLRPLLGPRPARG